MNLESSMKSINIKQTTLHDVEAIIRIHYAAVHQTAAGYYSETILDNWSEPLSQNRVDRISADISHPEKGGLDLAHRHIDEGLELFAKGDY